MTRNFDSFGKCYKERMTDIREQRKG